MKNKKQVNNCIKYIQAMIENIDYDNIEDLNDLKKFNNKIYAKCLEAKELLKPTPEPIHTGHVDERATYKPGLENWYMEQQEYLR